MNASIVSISRRSACVRLPPRPAPLPSLRTRACARSSPRRPPPCRFRGRRSGLGEPVHRRGSCETTTTVLLHRSIHPSSQRVDSEIEVVRGLVEEDDVGLRRRSFGEKDAHPPPAGEVAGRGVRASPGEEAEPRGDARRLRPRGRSRPRVRPGGRTRRSGASPDRARGSRGPFSPSPPGERRHLLQRRLHLGERREQLLPERPGRGRSPSPGKGGRPPSPSAFRSRRRVRPLEARDHLLEQRGLAAAWGPRPRALLPDGEVDPRRMGRRRAPDGRVRRRSSGLRAFSLAPIRTTTLCFAEFLQRELMGLSRRRPSSSAHATPRPVPSGFSTTIS